MECRCGKKMHATERDANMTRFVCPHFESGSAHESFAVFDPDGSLFDKHKEESAATPGKVVNRLGIW